MLQNETELLRLRIALLEIYLRDLNQRIDSVEREEQ
jgi:hypothetical protein